MICTPVARSWAPVAVLVPWLLLLGVPPMSAQTDAGAPALIGPTELAERVGDPSLVLLHVGSEAGYRTGHIIGARHITPSMLSAPSGDGRLTLELPDAAELSARLQSLGISSTSTVVVYHAGDAMSQATRVVFTLDYAGLGARTRLLDGGLAGWVAAGHPLTDAVVEPVPGPSRLVLSPRQHVVIGFDEMKALSKAPGNARIVDARTADFYSGVNDRGGQIPRPGHVPGAVNLSYADFFTRLGGAEGPQVLKSRAELEAMFAAAGIAPGQTVVTYCHIGQQATVPFLVARMLGYDVRLFDGSFEQWSADVKAPVEK